MTLLERIYQRVIPVPESGCHVWEGGLSLGYGSMYMNGKQMRVHRLTYELVRGAIPADLQLDHLCRVRCCVNPDHLEAVTCKTNVLRGIGPAAMNFRKTHCPAGHSYLGDNLYQYKDERGCRQCRASHSRKHNGTQVPSVHNAKKTHCRSGHPFSGDNLIVSLHRRECRECKRNVDRKRRAAKKAV